MTRLKNLMKRAANGESLVIGFLGGSITQGSLSSTPKTCYAYLVYEWWKKSFPNAAFSFVNGGIRNRSTTEKEKVHGRMYYAIVLIL